MTHSNGAARPRLHHVTMKTCRLDEMIAWYGEVVGCAVQHKFPGGAWLTNDEANHRIALLTSPKICDDPGKLGHSGLHHTAFEFESYDELLKTYVRLAAAGIVPHAGLDHGMTTSMYYVDPDGNSVELQADNFGNWDQSSAYMRTSPDFQRDPIGTPFDPEKVVAQWRMGVSASELRRRTFAGEFKPSTPLDLRFPV
jgi:catechol 2,3-dioxygenase